MVNPSWLDSFMAVSALGNFTRAGERLGITQAAVSQHIRQLEREFGPLLIRRPRSVELTPAGHALVAYGEDVGRARLALAQRLADADAMGGEVSLITPGSVGLMLNPKLLDMQQACPGLVVRHRFAPDAEVLDAVLHTRYELGLVTRRPDDERLEASYFTEEALELVAPAGAVLESWADLERLGFIDHPDGAAMATRLLARRFPGNPGVGALPVRGFVNQIGLILEPVARGFGFTVMPQYARQAFIPADRIAVTPCGAGVVDTLWLIRRAEWPLSKRAAWLADALMHAIADPARTPP